MKQVRTRQVRYRTQERAWFVARLHEARKHDGIQSGFCSHCNGQHAWPHVRWRCECGRVLCWVDVVRSGCCGGEAEVEP